MCLQSAVIDLERSHDVHASDDEFRRGAKPAPQLDDAADRLADEDLGPQRRLSIPPVPRDQPGTMPDRRLGGLGGAL
jgi:hypothetical protein